MRIARLVCGQAIGPDNAPLPMSETSLNGPEWRAHSNSGMTPPSMGRPIRHTSRLQHHLQTCPLVHPNQIGHNNPAPVHG